MILGLDRHPSAACFTELNDAVSALQREAGDTRTIVFNAHAFPNEIPEGAIVFNLENVGIQVTTDAFPGHEVWDFARRNVAAWKASGRDVRYVPIGFHSSMKRFEMRPPEERDIDVVFAGCVNERRAKILQHLADLDLTVTVVRPGLYGAERDAVLARSRYMLNMLYFDDALYPTLRAAHAVANGVPLLNEDVDLAEMPGWAQGHGDLSAFQAMPLVLPC